MGAREELIWLKTIVSRPSKAVHDSRTPVPILRADPPPHSKKPVTVRAIHANAGLGAWYRERLAAAVQLMHEVVSHEVLAAYGALEPKEYAHDAKPRNPSLLLRAALRKWGGLWVSKFDKLSLDLSKEFARKSMGMTQSAMRAALKEAGFTVKFSTTPGAAAAYQAVVAEQVNLIKSIPAEYLKAVESKVWSSVMKGADMHALSSICARRTAFHVSARR